METPLSSVLRLPLSWYSVDRPRFTLAEIAAALERPFFHDDDLEACTGQQFGGDVGPAPEPTMATSQVILSGSGRAPPRTFQPRCKPSRMGSGKLLMGCDVQRARGPG